MSNFREALKAQLSLHEGVKLKVYKDTLGIETIGVGRNLCDKGISLATAMQMLDEDIDECLEDLATFPWFSGLDPIRQRVLLDMRFNLGPSRFRGFKNMLKKVEAGDYKGAATNMLLSLWASQTKLRAKRLALMMETGKDYNA